MKCCEVKNQPLLAEVFDLRTCAIERDRKFEELVQTGIPLENNAYGIASELQLTRRFLETGIPYTTSFRVYQPLSSRVYLAVNSGLPFHIVASIHRQHLQQMEIVAYPGQDKLDVFQKASEESARSDGPGDDHPGSLGVAAFSLRGERLQVEYVQSSVNHRSGLITDLIDKKTARKYAGWQSVAVETMLRFGSSWGAKVVSAALGAKLSQAAQIALGWNSPHRVASEKVSV